MLGFGGEEAAGRHRTEEQSPSGGAGPVVPAGVTFCFGSWGWEVGTEAVMGARDLLSASYEGLGPVSSCFLNKLLWWTEPAV